MSKVIKKNGHHVWDGEIESVHIPGVGAISKWKTGIYGGGNEAHYCKLVSVKTLTEEELIALEIEHKIKNGTPFDSSRIPPQVKHENGEVFEYKWTYYPSTE